MSSLKERPTAATFDVETLVAAAWNGEIRVPHFQRGFRWAREDVRRLFDSIVKGYPVGSLLLWERPAAEQRVSLGALHFDAPATDVAQWVVDGQQRITALANALHPSGQSDQRFALSYNLKDGAFISSPPSPDPLIIPLPVIFDLQQILKWFAKYPAIAHHLDDATGVTKRLRQFPIPAYVVKQGSPDVLQDIFDRMNNYGKRLKRAEVFSALYAGDESKQDETLTIERIGHGINVERQFGTIDDDTILRAILARRGPDVTRDIHHEFDNGQEDRDAAYKAGEEALLRAVKFVQEQAGVPHFHLLPYRFLLVVLTRFFAHYPDPGPEALDTLRSWFWRAAVVGPYIFRGSATGAMKAQTYKISTRSMADSLTGLIDVVERSEHSVPNVARLRTNEGAGKIILCSLWALGPRDPLTADSFEQPRLARAISESNTAAPAIAYVVNPRNVGSSRRLSAGNRLILCSGSHPVNEVDILLSNQPVHLGDVEWESVLASHAMTRSMAGLLAASKTVEFLQQREQIVQSNLQNFLSEMCGWKFDAVEPLQD
ncbi:DUF262 domain-containing protein [Streptomyces sp. SID3212]|uniref:GmrSD restriction endonuclease domain-containing protein n=1 Tax=unclassified Streptomyces TaxID=2593676 RepID=UPI00136A57C7|nr:DUF262 domain-containing protein [Streptomyces sp. SID3212]